MLERLGTAFFGFAAGIVWLLLWIKPLASSKPAFGDKGFEDWPWNQWEFLLIMFLPTTLLIGLGFVALFRRTRTTGTVPPVVEEISSPRSSQDGSID